jgi:hypothetical protein
VSTIGDVSAAAAHFYLAAISSKTDRVVQQVTGLGLSWAPLGAQCGARSQTGIEVWAALGDGRLTGPVTAVLEGSPPDNAVIVVSRYSGVDTVFPTGDIASANTLGVAGPCEGGVDTTVYAVDVATEDADAVVYSAVGIRKPDHTAGLGFSETAEIHHGVDIADSAGVAVQQMSVPLSAIMSASGSLSDNVDWAVVAIELRLDATPPILVPSLSRPTLALLAALLMSGGYWWIRRERIGDS